MRDDDRSLLRGCVVYIPRGDIPLEHGEFRDTVNLIKHLGGVASLREYTHVIIIRPYFSTRRLHELLSRLPLSIAPILGWGWLRACQRAGRRLNWRDDWGGHLLRAPAAGSFRPSASPRPMQIHGNDRDSYIPLNDRLRSRSPPRRYDRALADGLSTSRLHDRSIYPDTPPERSRYDDASPAPATAHVDRLRDTRDRGILLQTSRGRLVTVARPPDACHDGLRNTQLEIDAQAANDVGAFGGQMLPTPASSRIAKENSPPKPAQSFSRSDVPGSANERQYNSVPVSDRKDEIRPNSTRPSPAFSPALSAQTALTAPNTGSDAGDLLDGRHHMAATGSPALQDHTTLTHHAPRPVTSLDPSNAKQRLFVDEFGEPLRFRVYGTDFERRILKRDLAEYSGVVLARSHPIDKLPFARYTVFPTGADRVVKDPDQVGIAKEALGDRSTTVVCADWVQQCIERGRLIRPDTSAFGVILRVDPRLK